MTAAVTVQRPIHGMECGAPGLFIFLFDVEKPSAHICRDIIVAVAQDALKLRVTVEAVAASGIADEGEKLLAAQIVDPGHGSCRGFNYILFSFIVKKTILHDESPPDGR